MISTLQLCLFYSYGLPLLIINLRIVYVLKAERATFLSSYYRLFFICRINVSFGLFSLLSSFQDITLYVVNNLFVRLPMYQPISDQICFELSESRIWPALMMFSIRFASHFTHLGMFLMCLNRFTAIVFYISYEKVCENYMFIHICILDMGRKLKIRYVIHVRRIIYNEFPSRISFLANKKS